MKAYKVINLILLYLLLSGGLMGQVDHAYKLWQNSPTDDFSTICRNVENFYAGKDKGRGTGYKQFKRWQYFMQDRLTSDGKITNVAARNWDAYNQYVNGLKNKDLYSALVTNGGWSSLGISYYTNGAGWNPGVGRVNVIAFHPTNANTFWAGAPGGGLWETVDGGSVWFPLTDGMPRIGISGIAVDYTNPNVIYILTGDGDAGDSRSIGVLKTADGGTTWTGTGLTWNVVDDVRGFKLVMHPTCRNILFVVASNGVWRTTDYGDTWTHVLNYIRIYDMEFKPGSSNNLYIAGDSTFWLSSDTGSNWTQITSGLPVHAQRMAIGVTPDNSSYVYLFAGPPTGVGSFVGVYRSTDSGQTFALKTAVPNILGYESDGQDAKHQTWYDLAVAVSASDANTLVTGAINCWKSTNGGTSFTIISKWDDYDGSQGIGYTHADIHNLTLNPLNGYLYCCSDGGIFKSTDFGENWTDLTNMSITEWYRIAGLESNSNLIIGGTQDNGSDKWTGSWTMQHILGADGMDCMIDPTNSDIMYFEGQNGEIHKSFNGGSTNSKIADYEDGPWIVPLVMNHATPTTIYAGYYNVRKSIDGGFLWSVILSMGAQDKNEMVIGYNDPNVLYVSNGAQMWRSDDAGSNWTNISPGLTLSTPISFIAVDPDDALNVFITLGGYTSGTKVFFSSNGGGTWFNYSFSLPNIPVNCVAFEDNNNSPGRAVYIGTDIGVFYWNEDLYDWIPFQNGLPTVPVFDLEINKTAGLIRAATFGRGLWSSQLYSPCPASYTLTANNDPSNPYYTGFQYYEASGNIESSRTITGGVGTDVTYKAGDYLKLTDGFHALDGNAFKAILGPCTTAVPQNPVKPVTGIYISRVQNAK